MGDMDSSTRSTDHMLGGDDTDFSLGISLSSLGNKLNKNKRSDITEEEEDDDHDNRFSNKPSKSNFDHLIPKKHHNKLNKLHKNNKNNFNGGISSDSIHGNNSQGYEDSHDVTLAMTDSSVGTERYRLWEGKNKFFCGGRFMMGVHSKHLVMTTILLLGTNALFLFLLVPLLHQHYLFHISATIGGLNLLFLFLTAFTDPGIIPRRPPSKLLENMTAESREKLQYCHTCRIVRPPRAKHCRYCDNCVEVFDHHW
jgi:hypothetical protein